MKIDPTPAEIARRLSKAQRKAISNQRNLDAATLETLVWLLANGIQAYGRLTPLGLAVRAELERMEAGGE